MDADDERRAIPLAATHSCTEDVTMRFRISPIPVLAAAGLVLAAAACESPLPTADEQLAFSAVNADGSVNKPFKAAFTTASTGLVPDPACGPYLLEHQVGEGEATHLGRFTADFTFCIDPTDLLDDGQLTGSETIPYWDGFATFTAANGDQLFVEIEGEIIPGTRPGFALEFHDDFEFAGGTGRFAGAYGNGSTDSYVQQSPNFVVHDFSGILTVFPGS
ncbi:MAG: hypothetical protein PVH00_15685 [Gemmatimonadota bacterium]|jgi:hypothetical protein